MSRSPLFSDRGWCECAELRAIPKHRLSRVTVILAWRHGLPGLHGLRSRPAEAAEGATAPALRTLRKTAAQCPGADAGCGRRGAVHELGSRLGAAGADGRADTSGRAPGRGGADGVRGREAAPSARVAGASPAGSRHRLKPLGEAAAGQARMLGARLARPPGLRAGGVPHRPAPRPGNSTHDARSSGKDIS